MALVGNGQVYSVELKDGEQYIAHPRYVFYKSGVSSCIANNQIVMSSPTLCRPTLLDRTASNQPR